MTEDGVMTDIATTPDKAGGIGWLPDGTLLVVAMDERRICKLVDDRFETYIDLSEMVETSLNDMLVLPDGGLYVGGFGGIVGEPQRPVPAEKATRLIYVSPGGDARFVGEPLIFPNGMAVTPDLHHLVVSESYAGCLTRFRIAPDADLLERDAYANFGDESTPDGIAMDAERGVWFGSVTTHEFVHVDWKGVQTGRVDMGDRKGVACALGGADGRTLFLLGSQYDDFSEVLAGTAAGYVASVRV